MTWLWALLVIVGCIALGIGGLLLCLGNETGRTRDDL